MPWRYVITDINGEEILETFCEKDLQKVNQKDLIVKKAIKRKGDKLYVKWKNYDNLFNGQIDENDIE